MHIENKLKAGLAYTLSAFILWGLVPIFFKALTDVSALEVLSHRILWSVVFLSCILFIRKQWSSIRGLSWQTFRPLILSSVLVSLNWFIFIWAVGQNRILETSLGYFINPLISVMLGMFFLGERLRPLQGLAVLLALFGVLNQLWFVGSLPWVAIVLALSFGLYGLIRKKLSINPVAGLFVETCLMLPFALGSLLLLQTQSRLAFNNLSLEIDMLLMFAGLVTCIPLLLFAAGTQRLNLNVIGMVQYITPTLSFLLAVFLYREPFALAQLITFVWIWAGLLIFTGESIYQTRLRQKKRRKTCAANNPPSSESEVLP